MNWKTKAEKEKERKKKKERETDCVNVSYEKKCLLRR